MRRAYLQYLSALLLFGTNGVVASRISLSSYEIVFCRAGIGSLFLLALFLLARGKWTCQSRRRELIFLLASGAAMGGSWMLLYEAYSQIGVSLATLTNYCGPVFLLALAPLLFRERLAAVQGLGFLAVFAGILLVNHRAFAQGRLSWGLVCGVLAGVLYAAMVALHRKTGGISGLENPLLQLLAGFLTVALFTLIRQGAFPAVSPANLPPILLMGVVNSGVGCLLYFTAIPKLPAGTVALFGYLEPVSALLFSALLLGERLGGLQLLGTLLILGGALFAECLRPGSPLWKETAETVVP